ncbi:hypothetical protein K2X05_04450, partial [bacterium]|nr:hypothetical protein [bacterium]
VFSLLTIAFVASCSETDSDKVEFTFIPDNPQVKFVDGKVQTGTDSSTNLPVYEDIEAPWFKFKITVSNGSAKNLVVDSLKLTMTGLSGTTGTVAVTAEITAASYLGVTPLPTSVVEVNAGGTSLESPYFYIKGLSTAVTSGVYNVEVLAEGWFGTVDNPGAKFSQKYFFTTD